MAEKQKKEKDPNEGLNKRLDAIIRLLIETNKNSDGSDINYGESARLLKSLDFTPTEIAKIFGKKSRTDVASLLYGKKKTTSGGKNANKTKK